MRPNPLSARHAWRWAAPLALCVLFLNGCAGPGGEREVRQMDEVPGDAVFPVPAQIQDNVDFWRHVYGVWSRGEVAIHDDEHLGVVHEVARIPGPIQAGYSASQQAWLASRMGYHASRLKMLEERVRTGQTLAASDKELLARFEPHGGAAALYGASDRLRAQRGLRERFRRSLEISGRYDPVFREIMRSHGVPEDLAYLPHVESSFQMNAKSSAGASGVWQFMHATGRTYMTVNDMIDERYDPILAADGAARYLSQAHRKLGSWPLAITSYNHGQGGMAKARSQYGNDIGRIVRQYRGKAFGFASRNYYAEFIAAREVARHPARYFPEGVRFEEPWPHDRLVLRHGMPADHVARHYGASTHQLADLNLHWRDPVRSGRASLPAGSTVWLPAGSLRRVASHPPPLSTPSMLARLETRPTDSRPAAPAPGNSRPAATPSAPVVASKTPTTPSSRPRGTAEETPPRAARERYHVVKPQETLYRVAVLNGLSVSELRQLNRMRADENQIQPGQRLKVGI